MLHVLKIRFRFLSERRDSCIVTTDNPTVHARYTVVAVLLFIYLFIFDVHVVTVAFHTGLNESSLEAIQYLIGGLKSTRRYLQFLPWGF